MKSFLLFLSSFYIFTQSTPLFALACEEIIPYALKHLQKPLSSEWLAKLRAKDPRQLFLELSQYAPTLKRIDNLTSVATQQLIGFDKNTRAFFQKINSEDSLLKNLIENEKLELHSEALLFLEDFERRFRAQAEILNAASYQKKSQALLSKEDYYKNLKKELIQSLRELDQRKKGVADIFPPQLLKILEKTDLAQFASSETKESLLKFRNTSFTEAFLKSIDPRDLSKTYQHSDDYLTKALKDLPVEISYAINTFTSDIRFGNRHYYGDYKEFRSISRSGYIKKSKKEGGVLSTEFRASLKAKKDWPFNSTTLTQS